MEKRERQSDEVVIQFTRAKLQERAKQELGRYLSRKEEEIAIDLAEIALYEIVGLTVQMNDVEPGPE